MAKKHAANPGRSPTMDDVAERANVSQMTVSRVLRKKGYVSDAIAERVHQAAKDLGYVPNRLAGGLAGQHNALVGVVLPTLRNRVFTDVLAGITQALAACGAQPVFGVSEYSQHTEAKIVQDLISWRPMGLILAGLEHDAAIGEMLRASSLRLAEIMDVDGTPISACFGFSHHLAGADMAHHLFAKGYRRFGYIGCQIDLDLRAAKRQAGFIQTITDLGGSLVAQCLSNEPSSMLCGRLLTQTILEKAERPEVIYYANDDLASGGLMHCIANAIDVPADVALAGFNGLSFLQSMPLQMTTTRSPRFDIGLQAGRYVSGAGEGDGSPETVDLGTVIEPGETS